MTHWTNAFMDKHPEIFFEFLSVKEDIEKKFGSKVLFGGEYWIEQVIFTGTSKPDEVIVVTRSTDTNETLTLTLEELFLSDQENHILVMSELDRAELLLLHVMYRETELGLSEKENRPPRVPRMPLSDSDEDYPVSDSRKYLQKKRLVN